MNDLRHSVLVIYIEASKRLHHQLNIPRFYEIIIVPSNTNLDFLMSTST